MEAVGGLAQLLQTYGAWGVVAILMIVVGFQWRAYVSMRDKNDEKTGVQNTKVILMVEETTKAQVDAKNAIVNVGTVLSAFERRLENVEKKLG